MSHYSVIVITPEKPTDDSLAAALQPFHEYESTGVEDQYVVWDDCHDEVTSQYANETETRWVDGNGNRFSPYEDRLYREPTKAEIDQIGQLAGTGEHRG